MNKSLEKELIKIINAALRHKRKPKTNNKRKPKTNNKKIGSGIIQSRSNIIVPYTGDILSHEWLNALLGNRNVLPNDLLTIYFYNEGHKLIMAGHPNRIRQLHNFGHNSIPVIIYYNANDIYTNQDIDMPSMHSRMYEFKNINAPPSGRIDESIYNNN